jgi:hypothetical protein
MLLPWIPPPLPKEKEREQLQIPIPLPEKEEAPRKEAGFERGSVTIDYSVDTDNDSDFLV